MNRLNGPYSYGLQAGMRGDMWEIHDAHSNVIAICETSHYAQQVAAVLTDAWKRELAAIATAESLHTDR
jgi:hypothetical protein